MTSPVEKVQIICPRCGIIYEDWWRPSINLDLDNFDEKYIDDASSATCPDCHYKIKLGQLVVKDGVFYLPDARALE